MSITPDALLLGPLALSWPNLALLLGILTFISLAARQGLESKGWWVLLATLLAARLGFALDHSGAWPSLGAALLGIVDIRTGGWNWLWGLLGGLALAVVVLRQKATTLLVPATLSLLVALVPLGIQQSLSRPADVRQGLEGAVLAQLTKGQPELSKVYWKDLPKPMLVSLWATWCASCRTHMPLLVEYQARGYPIVLLNLGEQAEVIAAYLQENRLAAQITLDTANLHDAFQVAGLPTTLLIGPGGEVLARQMGPLNRAQLEQLLRQLQQ
jgi:thiol-disulfide isomerase/thioredoxin